ncbi:MAG: insulinase family protein, partial [Pseudomonadota bacterium]|nr:insulinase family protein [Pseudomonadota bacterium]
MKKTYIIIILIAIFSSAIGFSMVSGLRGTADKLSTAETSTEKKVISKEKAFNAESFMLENGMRVVLIENHRAPIVSHMMWYDVGAADEDWGNSGIAHFFEH